MKFYKYIGKFKAIQTENCKIRQGKCLMWKLFVRQNLCTDEDGKQKFLLNIA